jgi:hypothetical protein
MNILDEPALIHLVLIGGGLNYDPNIEVI